MNRDTKRQIVATLIRADRRDLARLLVGAAPEVKVGLSWESVQGTRKVVQIDESRGLAFIQTGDRRGAEIFPVNDVIKEMEFEQKQLASKQKMQKTVEEREAKEAAEKAKRENTYGFAENFPPMRRQKILDALLRQVKRHGDFVPLKQVVEELYSKNYEIVPHAKFKQIAQSPDGGSFMTQRDLTKTGLDYLQYLRDKRIKVKAGVTDVREELIRFFKENPNPKDSQVHELAEQLGINAHELEGVIYSLLSEALSR